MRAPSGVATVFRIAAGRVSPCFNITPILSSEVLNSRISSPPFSLMRNANMPAPSPPVRTSFPSPPISRSSPLPPLISSLPWPPNRSSLPPPPTIWSSPLPPARRSRRSLTAMRRLYRKWKAIRITQRVILPPPTARSP